MYPSNSAGLWKFTCLGQFEKFVLYLSSRSSLPLYKLVKKSAKLPKKVIHRLGKLAELVTVSLDSSCATTIPESHPNNPSASCIAFFPNYGIHPFQNTDQRESFPNLSQTKKCS
jgi:hypothetical protein